MKLSIKKLKLGGVTLLYYKGENEYIEMELKDLRYNSTGKYRLTALNINALRFLRSLGSLYEDSKDRDKTILKRNITRFESGQFKDMRKDVTAELNGPTVEVIFYDKKL